MVGVTGAFTLTPLFSHNQSAVLNQCLSPASSIAYDSPNIDFNHVEVGVLKFFNPFVMIFIHN